MARRRKSTKKGATRRRVYLSSGRWFREGGGFASAEEIKRAKAAEKARRTRLKKQREARREFERRSKAAKKGAATRKRRRLEAERLQAIAEKEAEREWLRQQKERDRKRARAREKAARRRRDKKGRFVKAPLRPKKPTTIKGPDGRFHPPEEAKRLWRNERARQRRREKREQARLEVEKRARPRGPDGRFLSREETKKLRRRERAKQRREERKRDKRREERARKRAAKLAIETKKRAAVLREERAIAAKLGWQKVRQKKLEEAFREAAEKRPPGAGPSERLRTLFVDPRWVDGSYHQFEDGQQEGQLTVAPGPADKLRDRMLALEAAIGEILGPEPVWVQVGVTAMPTSMTDADLDRYEKYGGQMITLTFPRRAEEVGSVFAGAREIAVNMAAAGFDVTGLVVRTTYGDRPTAR